MGHDSPSPLPEYQEFVSSIKDGNIVNTATLSPEFQEFVSSIKNGNIVTGYHAKAFVMLCQIKQKIVTPCWNYVLIQMTRDIFVRHLA